MNSTTLKKVLNKYDYSFPKNLIASKPASPRDGSRVLVYSQEKDMVVFDKFFNFTKYLPQKTILVVNETRVIPARLMFKKETGGKVYGLFVREKIDYCYEFLFNKKITVGHMIYLSKKKSFRVVSKEKGHYLIRPCFKLKNFHQVLKKYGRTPVPPYISKSKTTESNLRKSYQTVFAKKPGSVAAPTASLHFTKRLLKKIKKSGIVVRKLTLEIGLGTFAPISSENLLDNKLHVERYEIKPHTAKFLFNAKKMGYLIIAVGTTSLRALETASNSDGNLVRLQGETALFIRPGYKFKFIDGLITNFHVPRSSLLMLVSALISRQKVLKLYKLAIKNNFRLFSFGDAMLVLPKKNKT